MFVTVYLRPDIARDMERKTPRHGETGELKQTLAELGLELLPMHEGVEDEELRRQFFIELADDDAAEDVTRRLLRSDAVEAAYTKPHDEPPSR
jgi:hypothetical protein